MDGEYTVPAPVLMRVHLTVVGVAHTHEPMTDVSAPSRFVSVPAEVGPAWPKTATKVAEATTIRADIRVPFALFIVHPASLRGPARRTIDLRASARARSGR